MIWWQDGKVWHSLRRQQRVCNMQHVTLFKECDTNVIDDVDNDNGNGAVIVLMILLNVVILVILLSCNNTSDIDDVDNNNNGK